VRILVTGASGFIGRYLSSYAAEQGHEVIGTYLSRPELSSRIPTHHDIRWTSLDIRDAAAVQSLVESLRPDAVFHLAAQAYAQPAWKDPQGTFDTNVQGTIHLYEALRKAPPSRGVLLAASASAYGTPPGLPITEEMPLRPVNPYAVSKATQEMLSYQYFVNYGLRIVRGRLFCVTGPGKTGDVVNDIAQQIATTERDGGTTPIRVGNLEARRDISDVRDAVRALWRVFEAGDPREPINVGAGTSFLVRELVEELVRRSHRPLHLAVDPVLLRPSDEPHLWADIARLKSLGFQPQYPMAETLGDALQFWRESAIPLRP
jgi:GDP-4-dehydro-6-deoxy-D-mannose reductase